MHTCKTCGSVHLFRFPKMINVSTPLRAAEHRAQPTSQHNYLLSTGASALHNRWHFIFSGSEVAAATRLHTSVAVLPSRTVAERFVILIKSIITECMYVVCVQTPLLLSLSRLGASLISLRYGGASCVLITCASVIVSSSNGRARTAKIYVHTQTVTSVRFQPVRANTSPLILWPCFDIFVNRLPKCVDDNNPKKKALLENGKRLEGGFCREGCTTTYWKLVKIRQNSPHHRSDAL